jgi:hypothetical protein
MTAATQKETALSSVPLLPGSLNPDWKAYWTKRFSQSVREQGNPDKCGAWTGFIAQYLDQNPCYLSFLNRPPGPDDEPNIKEYLLHLKNGKNKGTRTVNLAASEKGEFIRCGTAMPRTFWNKAPIFVRYRYCLGIPILKQRKFTRMSVERRLQKSGVPWHRLSPIIGGGPP